MATRKKITPKREALRARLQRRASGLCVGEWKKYKNGDHSIRYSQRLVDVRTHVDRLLGTQLTSDQMKTVEHLMEASFDAGIHVALAFENQDTDQRAAMLA